jgi:5-(carboxyamino)imidazole ribonucleotide synthase
VPAESAQWLAARVPVFPSPRALAVAQDRLAEKTLFRELGIPVPEFADIDSRAALDAAVVRLGTPCILKTRRLGYDGKGQFRIKSPADVDAAWEALGAQAGTVGLILEGFVAFQRELSVVAVRGQRGEFRAWPLTENWHVDGVLSASLAPARVDGDECRRDVACAQARRRAGLRGRVRAGAVLPRRRTAGQRTGAARAQLRPLDHRRQRDQSQFQNHLRAVLGLPLGDTAHARRGLHAQLDRRDAGCRPVLARPADTGTTTASSRAPAARSGMPRCVPTCRGTRRSAACASARRSDRQRRSRR